MPENPVQFASKRDALMLPPCEPDSKTPYAWYKHASQAGFYIRVSKPDAHGKVDRRYIHRYKAHEADGAGGTKSKEKRDDLGAVTPGPRADYDEALRKVLEKRKELKNEQVEGTSTRLTVAGAWAFYSTEKFTNKTATVEKDEGQYQRYLAFLGNRYLDELPRTFWAIFMEQLKDGELVAGTKTAKDGSTVPNILGPLVNSSLIGVMNTAALLYDIANKYNGLQGELKGQNPPASLRKNIGAPNQRTTHIPLKDLGRAWRASDQLIAPWWRDMFQVFVLTGLRRSLLFGMRFDEIDFDNGVYIIAPDKRGAKRKGVKITASTPPIRLPLSRYVTDILRRRREFAPDKNGLVWFTPKPTRGRRTKKDAASLSDPRGAWTLLEWAIGGMHFSPHDLRRTYATAGTVATHDLFAISLLMLHTGKELARAAGVPGITIQYIDTAEAVDRMRAAAEAVTTYVLRLATMPDQSTGVIEDPVLHPEIEEALLEAA